MTTPHPEQASDLAVAPLPTSAPLERTPRNVVADASPKRIDQPVLPLVQSSAYLFSGFPLALLSVVVAVILIGVGAGTAIFGVGIPLVTAGLSIVCMNARVERRQIAEMGMDVPEPTYAQPGSGTFDRLTTKWRDPQVWEDAWWSVVNLLSSTVGFGIALSWWTGALCIIGGPIAWFALYQAVPVEEINSIGTMLGGGQWTDSFVAIAGGALFALTLKPVLAATSRRRAEISHTLLCSRAQSERELAAVVDSRAALRRAETVQMRRIERDIHDGPQQRLVRLKMDLARARRLASSDPEKARHILDEAMGQTTETLTELRHLSRGIAPPILVDRGLLAALDDLAARSTIPCAVETEVDRIPQELETVVYFFASECVANANKHSFATMLTIELRQSPAHLEVAVSDDGVGGADLAKGHGLVGVAARVAATDGQMNVESPSGGPTRINAVLPCA